MKKIFVLLLIAFLALPVFAEEEITDEGGVKSSSSLLLQISTLPEAKLGFTQNFNFPFLQGNNFLTEGNNLNLALTAEVSPISLNGLLDITLTPVAVLEFSAGGRIGSGWNVNLFGGDIFGIGLTQPDDIDGSKIDGNGFDGLHWKAYGAGMFQFDFAAIFPGDWNHVVTLTYHEINYKSYSRAKAGESWVYEADDGENINGFNYYGNFLIGYQMPIFLNLVALLAEMDLFMYDTPGRSGWGDDLIRWHFSGILSFEITEQLGIAVITQFRTRRNFTEETKNLYYRSRILDTSNPQRLEFYRVAAAITYTF